MTKILAIDDDQGNLSILSRILRRLSPSFSVMTVKSGLEGIEKANTELPDVILLDIMMPKMDGYEVCERLKSDNKTRHIPVVMLTANTDSASYVKSLELGADAFLTKPIEDVELVAQINAMLRIKRAGDLLRNEKDIRQELIDELVITIRESEEAKRQIEVKMREELERKLEERTRELSQTQAQLFQTSKLVTLGEMSAGLAHEMNQPLGGMSLTAKYLSKLMERGELTDEEIESGLRDIETSVKRMSRIIQHIRTFARQETLTFIDVNVNETIDSALSLLGEQLRLHAIEVKLELDPALPKITGEPYQLEQVWINIISNARDALAEKEKQITDGKLQITNYNKSLIISTTYNTESEIPSVDVRFQDNGIGFAMEQKKRIFEPFFTTKEVGKGMGLGLSITHGIIESHKGTVEVEGKAGEGVAFRIILPIGD